MILTGDHSQILYPRQACPYNTHECNTAMNWELFYNYVCMLLSSWHVFRAIYEYNIVSFSQFSQKSNTMACEIVTFFQSCGNDACESEVAGFLLQVLAEDFKTDVEDDSDLAVARWLVDGYAYILHGDFSLVQELQYANLPLLPGFDGQVIPPRPVVQKKVQSSCQGAYNPGAIGPAEQSTMQPEFNDFDSDNNVDADYMDEDYVDDDYVDDGTDNTCPYDNYL